MAQTFREIIHNLAHLDDLPDDFDPAQVVGDVRDKVDSIKYKIDEWLAQAEMLKTDWLQPIAKQREALIKRAERLEDYVRFEMEQNQFDKIPGNLWRVQLQKTAPKVNILRECGPSDLLAFPDVVSQKVSYSWNSRELMKKLKDGEKLSFAYLTENKALRFYPVKGQETNEQATSND